MGDFRAQTRRTFHNITGLLAAEGATWKDIVRTTCYLRDIDRDYAAFNEERTASITEQGLDPLPASTGIQAMLCRPELLVEIEAIAMFGSAGGGVKMLAPVDGSARAGRGGIAVGAGDQGLFLRLPTRPVRRRTGSSRPYANDSRRHAAILEVHQALLRELHEDSWSTTARRATSPR